MVISDYFELNMCSSSFFLFQLKFFHVKFCCSSRIVHCIKSAMGNCFIYSSKKSRNYFVLLNFSFTSTSSPWATYRHLTDICAWGWGIWTLLGVGGEFELEVSSLFSWIQIWSMLKVNNGLEEKVYEVLKCGQCIEISIFTKKLGKAFEHNVCPKGWEFEQTYLQKFKFQGVGCWSFKLMK